jgi:hypothetical protein
MAYLSGFNILIIDFPEACELRASLLRARATVHVVSPSGALILAGRRRIDAAFVGFGVDAATRRLCEELTDLGVGQIIVTAGDVGMGPVNSAKIYTHVTSLGCQRIC